MQSALFIRMLEEEYDNIISDAVKRPENSSIGGDILHKSLPDEAVTRFKNWFSYVLQTAEVTAGETAIEPEEAIAFAVSRTSSTPPFRPYFPKLHQLLSLYSDTELDELFGTSRSMTLQRAMALHKNMKMA